MIIGIVGGGIVGHATARCFMEWAEVRVYDVLSERRTHSPLQVLEADIVFVCLPEAKLDSFIGDCRHEALANLNLVLKSTVPIGATKRLSERYGLANIVHSPEFLTARCAVTDAQLPARNIIGVPSNLENACSIALAGLYGQRFPGVSIYLMSSDESEAVKLFTNAFFSVKIAFFNECQDLAAKSGMNWNAVLNGVLADGRIAHSHTRVPGPDGKFGFGGACLPKDLDTLLDCMRNAKVPFEGDSIVKAALRRNSCDRTRS